MMRDNILNLFGIGKWPFSASLASLLAIPLYVSSLYISKYIPHPMYFNVISFTMILLWSMVELRCNSSYAKQDPKEVVIDEFLGMHSSLTIACTADPLWIAILFLMFRVFDRFKIFPVNILERKLRGTYGLLWDDIAIGASTAILFRLGNGFFMFGL